MISRSSSPFRSDPGDAAGLRRHLTRILIGISVIAWVVFGQAADAQSRAHRHMTSLNRGDAAADFSHTPHPRNCFPSWPPSPRRIPPRA